MTIGWTIDEWKEYQSNVSSKEGLQAVLELVSQYRRDDTAWITIASPDQVKSQWESLERLDPTSKKDLPLYGIPYAVKDNIDVAGFATTAACPAFLYKPSEDATVVSLLRKAGAIVVGKTNLDQFATGLVGTRSPYGKVPSAFSDRHVAGGSSAGSASVVSRGLVPFSLGTDTAGSGRVPAALNNVIGLKPTRGVISLKGVVPACKSLDCVSIFSLNLRDAQRIFNILAQYDPADSFSRRLPDELLTSFRESPICAVPSNASWYGEKTNPILFKKAVDKFPSVGVKIVPTDFSILYRLANCLYEGPWVAERYAALREFLVSGNSEMNPTVYAIIKGAEKYSAADAFEFEYLRQDILRLVDREFGHYDALIVPTCPLNPTFEDVAADPIVVNSRQGTYTNFVNLADFCALAIPSGFRPDGLPTGITLISKKFNDFALLHLAQSFLSNDVCPRKIGALGSTANGGDNLIPNLPSVCTASVSLTVIGHRHAKDLHGLLEKVGAKLKVETTCDKYHIYAVTNNQHVKPNILNMFPSGGPNFVEVWHIPNGNVHSLISGLSIPLGIGLVELTDGRCIMGFICKGTESRQTSLHKLHGASNSYSKDISIGSIKPFNTVLVANRGEIAVRIINTLKKLGIKSVAVYSEPDRYSQHVRDADKSVSLSGTTAAETYLSITKIIEAAKRTGAEAIIPGYGLLSENADFVEACEKASIVFVGPSADTIRTLGLKHTARDIAKKIGVPCLPGSDLLNTVEDALESAKVIGYPLMVKSTAGGGGIGLRCVVNANELAEVFDIVKHQGNSYFNDSGVFLERYVEKARHIEVQIIGDGHGKVISLGERDCSLQRRNQKVIEETPAPNLPEQVRLKMLKAAEGLARYTNYKCTGTVEFIYDELHQDFYFLEVNTRLQVEHTITESVTGLDLVEWMLYVAAEISPSFEQPIVSRGSAMEVRVYSENPVKNFQPSPGQITEVKVPKDVRVDTWVRNGTKITAEYDPTIAKIVVHGKDRLDALRKMRKALNETAVYGVVTNLDYLRSVVNSKMFEEADISTKVLDLFEYAPLAFEITFPGSYTTIQDYPGRRNLWHVGVPASGPMDPYSFRLANRIVGNNPEAPGIEATLVGPSIIFHCDTIIAITGGECHAKLDGEPVSLWMPVVVKAGQTFVMGKIVKGCRSYLAVRGGIDAPECLGSRSTFALGNLGGLNGRVLKSGDVIFIEDQQAVSHPMPASPSAIPAVLQSRPTEVKVDFVTWKIGVIVGPHGAPDFFTESSMATFLSCEWKVHHNSNRLGVRLIGPKPEWAREDGGEAGMHPSNTHDYVYSMGAINFTGDEPVILTCDGPSLGGFVCPAVVVEAEMWKVGQVKPGDVIQFVPVTYDLAIQLRKWQDRVIEDMRDEMPLDSVARINRKNIEIDDPIIYQQGCTADAPKVVYRQSGDSYVLIEYGENVMDLNLAYRVLKLRQTVLDYNTRGVVDISPGVRSLLIEFDGTKTSRRELVEAMLGYEKHLRCGENWTVPSRLIKLPFAFEDQKTLEAVKRYTETIRSTAPWLPNNVDFLTEVNHLQDRTEIRDILHSARFLVLGLGDVFLGAPCAVPLDPRHRLLGTKYNPSRTYTPNGTVGIGGMYMCIYTMESPGGYQLVGRTIPIWDRFMLGQQERPWLLSQFDQIEYFPVTEEELDRMCEEVEHGNFNIDIEDCVFDHGEYINWLSDNKKSIEQFRSRQMKGNQEILRRIQISNAELNSQQTVEESHSEKGQFSDSAVFLHAEVAGRFWKSMVVQGDRVNKSDGVVILEAMKTEMITTSPVEGIVVKIVHKNGDFVEAGDLVAVIEPCERQ